MIKEQENGRNWQMIRQAERRIGEKLVANSGVLKVTSRNVTKRLKLRQETRATIWAQKTVKAVVKHLANKKLQMEKPWIEGWKQMVIIKVMLELQSIKQAHEEVMTIQKQSFQLKLKRMKQNLE